jgi:hypothetical protein
VVPSSQRLLQVIEGHVGWSGDTSRCGEGRGYHDDLLLLQHDLDGHNTLTGGDGGIMDGDDGHDYVDGAMSAPASMAVSKLATG